MQQLCTWVQLGRLTYFNAVRALPPTLAQRVNADHRLASFFRPQSLPSAQRLLGLANQVAQEVASAMERQAKEMESQGEEQAQQAPLTFLQAQQLKRLVAAPAFDGQSSAAHTEDASSALLSPFPPSPPSSSNSSLLLRTWLEQLRLSSELHPLAMEIVQKLNLALVQRPKSRVGRPSAKKKARKEQQQQQQQQMGRDEEERQVDNTEKHVMLMATLVLTVQMTQDATATPRTPAAAIPTDASLANRDRQIGSISPPAADVGSSSSVLPSLRPNVAHFSADVPPSSIAANWLPSLSPFPSSLHSARSLPAHSQSEFVRWVGEVAMARLDLPKDFEVYVEEIGKVAESAGRTRQARRQKQLEAAQPPMTSLPSSGTLVSRLLACERVISYSSNRRGAYHPAYAALLQQCSALLGLRWTATLHAAVQRVIRLAQASSPGTESLYVDTTQQRDHRSDVAAVSGSLQLQAHGSGSSSDSPPSENPDAMEVDQEPNDSAEAVVVEDSSSGSPPFRRSSRISSASSQAQPAPSVATSTRTSVAGSRAPTRASSVSSIAGPRG